VRTTARGLGTSSVPTVAEVEELRAALNRKDKELAAKDEDMVAKLSAKDEQLAAKDEDMVAKLSAKDEQLAAKDKELEDLRAQLKMPLEGVPPK
jgi:seryl-tRNA synthetase